MRTIWQDLRYGARMLRKNLGLTAVIVLSLAIGIGANTAIFSVTDALLLRPLPYPNQDRLTILWLRSPGIGIPQDWPSPGQYNDIKTQNHVFDETAILIDQSSTLTGRTQAERIDGITASSTLLDMLGAKPLLGRTFLPEEDTPGKPATAVLTYGLWKRLFGGDPQVLGKSLTLDGAQYTVVGVLRPDFVLNHEVIPTIGGIDKAEIFLPLPLSAKDMNNYGPEDYNIVARLKPGVTVSQAQADVDIIASRIRERFKRDRTFTISVVPMLDQVVGNVRRSVLVLLGAVGLVLLIACANVANLLLARAAARQKEVAIRTALGAGWARMVRQLLTESVLLGLLGGAAGLLLALGALYLMRTINPGDIPRVDEIGINGGVLAFTFAISILTGVVFGLVPAFRAVKVDLNSTLKSGGRTSQSGGGLSVSRDKLRGLLAITEIALSLMLLVGAGLLIRSFVRLLGVPPGFNPDHVLSLRLSLTDPQYRKDRSARPRFVEDVGERIKALPGVTAEGATTVLPLTTAVSWGGFSIEGYVPPANQPELQVDQRPATPDYFRTLEIPLIKGRFFSESDTDQSQPVVLIDEKMAGHFWPNGDPIGQHVKPVSDPKTPWLTVVGVVGVVKQYGLDSDTRMVVYYPYKQQASGTIYFVARSTSDPANLAGAVTQAVHSVDPNVPVFDVGTMAERLHRSLARQRFSMTMLGGFAIFALILAAIGVYGVMSYLVTQGTRDIAIRIALGAQHRDVLGLVFAQGMAMAGIGIVAGLAGALSLSRVMASLLYGVPATDLLTFGAVVFLLTLVALAACYIPAMRAMRVDPLVALRYE
jgi:predicted permease